MTGLDTWVDVKGYEGIYQVSYCGEVRKIYGNGKVRVLSSWEKRGSLIVKLTINSKSKEYLVHHLVAEAFLGKKKDDEVIYHKNGMKKDNWASNLAYKTRQELGRITGFESRSKQVTKINSECEIVDVYSSAREASRQNFMSYQTIIDRCNGKVKSAFAPDGYAYAWDDSEVSVRNAIKKIKKETGKTAIISRR